MSLEGAAVHAYAAEVVRLATWLAILAAAFVPLERAFALRQAPVLRKGFAADVALYFLNGVVPAIVLSLPLALLADGVHRVMPEAVLSTVAGLPLWAKLPLALVIGEVGAYWGHRWTHEVPLLWQFHAVHHEAEHMDWLVNTRAHPLDMVFVRLCTLAPLYALGFAGASGPEVTAAPAAVLLVGTLWGYVIHANVAWRFGWFEQVLSSPAFHHWHHTLSGPINRNYSSMFPWMDRAFGTLHLPRAAWPESYGVLPEAPRAAAAKDGRTA
jgi:sterol desaturase/sphingolipid hydroxylase (fatty acid hydroxylase superfamily)